MISVCQLTKQKRLIAFFFYKYKGGHSFFLSPITSSCTVSFNTLAKPCFVKLIRCHLFIQHEIVKSIKYPRRDRMRVLFSPIKFIRAQVIPCRCEVQCPPFLNLNPANEITQFVLTEFKNPPIEIRSTTTHAWGIY